MQSPESVASFCCPKFQGDRDIDRAVRIYCELRYELADWKDPTCALAVMKRLSSFTNANTWIDIATTGNEDDTKYTIHPDSLLGRFFSRALAGQWEQALEAVEVRALLIDRSQFQERSGAQAQAATRSLGEDPLLPLQTSFQFLFTHAVP